MGRVRKFKSYYSGTVTVRDDEEIEVEAVAEEYHDPGCMYRRNGDPGDPPEDSFEIISCEPDDDDVIAYLENHSELFSPEEAPEW